MDANELARTAPPSRNWDRAKVSVPFPQPPDVVFHAAVQALRGARCEIEGIDWENRHARISFAAGTAASTAHTVIVFVSQRSGAELDISSRDPNEHGVFDPYYDAIIREVSKFLHFAPAQAPPPPPPILPPHREDDDYRPHRRRRREQGDDSFGIAAFVCGLVGVVTFCIPILGGGLGLLGAVFGILGIVMGRPGRKGLSIAGLVLGAFACLLSFLMFVVYLADAPRHRY